MIFKPSILCILTTSLFINSAWAQLESNTELKANYQSFLPKNWKILEKAQGDLNADRQADLALIIEDTNPKHRLKNDGLGSDQLNLNPRKLLILFKKPQGYQLAATNSWIPTENDAESPCLEDPLAENGGLEIKNGLLKLSFHYWLSCGSWYVTNKTYTFRYQDQSFKLIGYDSNDLHRASGATSEKSINFLTGKIKNTSGRNEFEETTQPIKINWSKLQKNTSLKLQQVKFNQYIEFE